MEGRSLPYAERKVTSLFSKANTRGNSLPCGTFSCRAESSCASIDVGEGCVFFLLLFFLTSVSFSTCTKEEEEEKSEASSSSSASVPTFFFCFSSSSSGVDLLHERHETSGCRRCRGEGGCMSGLSCARNA